MGKRWQTDYVSEFTVFMGRYLTEHPEIVEDQKVGWNIFWDHDDVDQAALREAAEDAVPDDCYGFYPADWVGTASRSGRP